MTPVMLRELADVARADAETTKDEDDADHLFALGNRLDAAADRIELATTGKRCMCCGAVYTTIEWLALPLVGVKAFGPDVLEYRNCTCGSTLTIHVTAEEAARVAA